MIPVLVSGAAGYIGAATCKTLFENDYLPIGIDNLSTGYESNVKWGPLYIGDISNQALVRQIITEHKPQAVIHFAANAYVQESVLNPLKYYKNNVGQTIEFLGALMSSGIDKLVFSSTCATYGEQYKTPLTEDLLQRPINPYGETKLTIEKLLNALSISDNFKSIVLRYFNASGAIPSSGIGENHDPETHLIPLCIQAHNSGVPVKVFGNDFDTPDGSAVRDYIHISDLAEAHVLALSSLLNGATSNAYNLGTGHGHSVMEIINGFEEVGIKIPWEQAERRAGDPPILIANSRKIRTELGWQPVHSSRFNILKTAVDFSRSN